jgi:hypothetical protein
MSLDHIRYDLLAQEALRGVVRQVLADVAKSGVPGEHHFYITFSTKAAGVKMSPRLRSQYPDEMRIVLQHQFWDLAVTEEAFEVGLSFGGVPERLSVPFAAVTAFVDPSVQFALQFTTIAETESEPDAAPVAAKPAVPAPAQKKSPTGPAVAQSRGETKPAGTPAKPPAASTIPDKSDEPDPPPGGGEVVRLDRFRKK